MENEEHSIEISCMDFYLVNVYSNCSQTCAHRLCVTSLDSLSMNQYYNVLTETNNHLNVQ